MGQKLVTPKSVRRVVRLGEDGPVVLHSRKKDKKKKQTWILEPIEKAGRRVAKAYRAGADSYLSRHDRSNRKNKDGWLRDYPKNAMKAARTGAKKLKVPGT